MRPQGHFQHYNPSGGAGRTPSDGASTDASDLSFFDSGLTVSSREASLGYPNSGGYAHSYGNRQGHPSQANVLGAQPSAYGPMAPPQQLTGTPVTFDYMGGNPAAMSQNNQGSCRPHQSRGPGVYPPAYQPPVQPYSTGPLKDPFGRSSAQPAVSGNMEPTGDKGALNSQSTTKQMGSASHGEEGGGLLSVVRGIMGAFTGHKQSADGKDGSGFVEYAEGDEYGEDVPLDEPPLLEELGIDGPKIFNRMKSVLFFHRLDHDALAECDLFGPLLIALSLGFCLLLRGKIHFGYIYGLGILGCLSTYVLLNLMSQGESIDIYRTLSILGYGLMPISGLAAASILTTLKNSLGYLFCAVVVLWCTTTASRFFESALNMQHQRFLVAYPICLLYACFVLISVF